MIKVCGPKDKPEPNDKVMIINSTSSSKTWTKQFSPFFLGPVQMPSGEVSQNVENAWQFSKVYPQYVDIYKNPADSYWQWARQGWASTYAYRYPMGKNTKPLYSFWNNQKLDYIEARKTIYIPIYEDAVKASGYFEPLVEFTQDCIWDGVEIYLFDFDGYDNSRLNLSYAQVIENPKRKMGHGFVLSAMLNRELNFNF